MLQLLRSFDADAGLLATHTR